MWDNEENEEKFEAVREPLANCYGSYLFIRTRRSHATQNGVLALWKKVEEGNELRV